MTDATEINALRAELRDAAADYERTGQEHDTATERLEDLVFRALRAGIRQTDIAHDINRPREAVRRIARRRNIHQ